MHAASALAPGLTAAALLSSWEYHGSCLAGPHTEFALVLCYFKEEFVHYSTTFITGIFVCFLQEERIEYYISSFFFCPL